MTDDVSDRAHEIIEEAVDDLRAAGFEGAAPWRMLAWVRLTP
jgi:hypothetical protein